MSTPHPDLSPIPDLDEDLINGLDKFIVDRDEPPAGRMSRNDAINVIVRDWLMSQNYIPIPDDGQTDLV